MNDETLVNGDPEFLTSILNAVTNSGELPAGVTILKTLQLDAEVAAVFESLKNSPDFAEETKNNPNLYEYQIQEDLGGILAIDPYTLVTNAQEQGIVALPKLVVMFQAGGDIQMINSNPVWFVFNNLSIAEEIILETQEIVDGLYVDDSQEEVAAE